MEAQGLVRFALFVSDDESNLGEMNSKHCSKFSIAELRGGSKLSDAAHLRPREFAVAVILAAQGYLSSLLVTVMGIISRSAKKQMVWIRAARIIARVEHTLTFRDWAVMKNPRSAMCFNAVRPSGAKRAIGGFPTNPFPAMTKRGIVRVHQSVFGNFLPEAFFKCFGKALRGQILCGNRWLHSVSRLIVCHALGCLVSAREHLRLVSTFREASAT